MTPHWLRPWNATLVQEVCPPPSRPRCCVRVRVGSPGPDPYYALMACDWLELGGVAYTLLANTKTSCGH